MPEPSFEEPEAPVDVSIDAGEALSNAGDYTGEAAQSVASGVWGGLKKVGRFGKWLMSRRRLLTGTLNNNSKAIDSVDRTFQIWYDAETHKVRANIYKTNDFGRADKKIASGCLELIGAVDDHLMNGIKGREKVRLQFHTDWYEEEPHPAPTQPNQPVRASGARRLAQAEAQATHDTSNLDKKTCDRWIYFNDSSCTDTRYESTSGNSYEHFLNA